MGSLGLGISFEAEKLPSGNLNFVKVLLEMFRKQN